MTDHMTGFDEMPTMDDMEKSIKSPHVKALTCNAVVKPTVQQMLKDAADKAAKKPAYMEYVAKDMHKECKP